MLNLDLDRKEEVKRAEEFTALIAGLELLVVKYLAFVYVMVRYSEG